VLTRRPATEVASGEEDRRVPPWLAVELEVGVFGDAIPGIPPVVEQVWPVSGPLDALEKLLGMI